MNLFYTNMFILNLTTLFNFLSDTLFPSLRPCHFVFQLSNISSNQSFHILAPPRFLSEK